MAAMTKKSDTGETLICVWAGPSGPNPDDDSQWLTLAEAEEQLAAFESHLNRVPSIGAYAEDFWRNERRKRTGAA